MGIVVTASVFAPGSKVSVERRNDGDNDPVQLAHIVNGAGCQILELYPVKLSRHVRARLLRVRFDVPVDLPPAVLQHDNP